MGSYGTSMAPRTARNRRIGITILLASMTIAAAAVGHAQAFSGLLSSSAGEVQGTGNWIRTGPSTIAWQVSQNGNGSWSYAYDFSHPRGGTSHFILEVSSTFTMDQIWNAAGDFEGIELGTWSASGSNPNMPGTIFGLKFDDASGEQTQISFDSWRVPVWGDFYSKDGTAGGYGQNAAWNAGLTANDIDPAGPAENGSLDNHLLVPDSQTSPPRPPNPVPEPGTLLLLGLGLGVTGTALTLRRRHA